jgi:hypothetical protein
MNRKTSVFAFFVLISTMLTLPGCNGVIATSSTPGEGMLLPMSTETSALCEGCAQASLAAALTQEKYGADNQAAATAEIVRAHSQSTLNSANATLSAARTQEQNDANVIAAQVAATAAIVRANAQATLVAAGSTQSAALTQDAIQQTQMAGLATTGAVALAIQQNKDEIAAGTQTAVADHIATQTQAAAATSQWYADQARQRAEQRQGPITFLWVVCLPLFGVLLACFILWGFWRRLRIQQANERIDEQPVKILPTPVEPNKSQERFHPPESNIVNGRYRLTQPDDQMRGWLDEIKRKLINRERDKDDNPES